MVDAEKRLRRSRHRMIAGVNVILWIVMPGPAS